MKLLTLLILIVLPLAVTSLSASCEKGSDAQCKTFGDNFCCAYVDIKSERDQLRGYYCSDKKYATEDYDYAGYYGKIICSAGVTWRGFIEVAVLSVFSLALIC
jgi:hypothetical protein